MKKWLFVFLVFIVGCSIYPPPKFKLTMIYPDGTTKIFEGHSVSRDNSSGEWSFGVTGSPSRQTFKGKVICEPILDLTMPSKELPAEANDSVGSLSFFMPSPKPRKAIKQLSERAKKQQKFLRDTFLIAACYHFF